MNGHNASDEMVVAVRMTAAESEELRDLVRRVQHSAYTTDKERATLYWLENALDRARRAANVTADRQIQDLRKKGRTQVVRPP